MKMQILKLSKLILPGTIETVIFLKKALYAIIANNLVTYTAVGSAKCGKLIAK